MSDFNAASNDEQIERLLRLAARALSFWDLPEASVELLKYRENAVFAVSSAGGRVGVLRIHRPRYRTDDNIRSELAWMKDLSRAGVHTPEVVPTKSGDVLAVVAADGVPEPRQCDVLAWVDGQPLGTLEGGVDLGEETLRRSYRTVGEIAARIHAHGAAWKRPAGFARRAWDLDSLIGEDPVFGRFWELDLLSEEQRTILFRARERARAELAALAPTSRSWGLTHGDLVPDNILVAGDDIRVVDFDDCGDTWYAFELTTSIFPLLGSPAFEPARDAYLEGYRGVRPFADAELAAMPSLLMARGLSYLGWPVGRSEMQSGRDIAPMAAYLVTDLAEKYLSDQL